MRTLRLTLEYDGTPFVGWQIQHNGPSVQAAVQAALQALTGERIAVVASGRTDAGVHALGQVISFETAVAHPLKAFREGLNRLLPPEIAVLQAEEAPPGFHALRSAKSKRYRYVLLNADTRHPLRRWRAWHQRFPLDLAAMRAGAAAALGEHDFAAFCAAESEARTTVRCLRQAAIEAVGADELHLEFEAPGFLHQMVRRLTGVLVEIGRGHRPPEHMAELLARAERSAAGPTAPPQGLFLVRVLYP